MKLTEENYVEIAEKAIKENTNTTSAVGDKQIEANKELAQTKTKSTWVPSEPTTK